MVMVLVNLFVHFVSILILKMYVLMFCMFLSNFSSEFIKQGEGSSL